MLLMRDSVEAAFRAQAFGFTRYTKFLICFTVRHIRRASSAVVIHAYHFIMNGPSTFLLNRLVVSSFLFIALLQLVVCKFTTYFPKLFQKGKKKGSRTSGDVIDLAGGERFTAADEGDGIATHCLPLVMSILWCCNLTTLIVGFS